MRLLVMEAGVILFAGLLGSGLAVLIPGRVPAAARIALAPAMGLAVGFPLTFAASQFVSMSVGAYALLIPLTVLSAAFAVVRVRRAGRPEAPPRSHLLCLALALAIPLSLFSAPLIDQRSLGPVSYQVSDAANYAAFNDRLEENTWGDEHSGLSPADDRLAHQLLTGPLFQGTGTFPLGAALNAVYGWAALDSQSALMIALLGIGALGCFGLVLTATRSAWAGLAAALLYAGPVNYQLFVDGSQAALAGLALLGPLAVVGSRLLREPIRAGALLGVLMGGILTVYTAFVPVVALSVGLGLAIHLLRERRIESLRAAAIASGVAVAVVCVLAALPLVKNVEYAKAVSDGLLEKRADLATWDEPVAFTEFGEREEVQPEKEIFPPFDVPAETVPAWLAQSRERFDLPALSAVTPVDGAVTVVLLPALAILLAALGVWRFRAWAFLLLPAAVSLVLAYYGFEGQDCSYCGGRALLAITPILAVFASFGLVAGAALIRARAVPRGAGVAAVAGLILIAFALANDRALAERLVDSGYMLRGEAREVSDAASGEVLLEGTGVGHPATSFFESNVLPQLLRQSTGESPLLDWQGLAIALFPEQYPPGLIENPDYRLVFTRLAGISGDRRVVAEDGPYALEERAAPLDVTVVNGVVADIAQRDPSGQAWVTGPVTVLLADSERRPAEVVLGLAGPAAKSLRLEGPGEIVHEGDRALVCVPAPGGAAVRRVDVPLRFEEPTYVLPDEAHELPIPEATLELRSLSASRECPPGLDGGG